jgi:hypothetical protein
MKESVNSDGWNWLPKELDSAVIFAPNVISDTGRVEMATTFSQNGDTVYFSIRSKRVDGRNFWTLMSSAYVDGAWTRPDTLPFSNKFSDYGAYPSPDGQFLYFSSRRPILSTENKMKGDYDLWVSLRKEERLNDPIRLADGINTNLEEYSVAVTNTNLIICSERNDSLGMTDLFIVPRSEEMDVFNSKKNLGKQVNSKFYEGNCFMDPDETVLVFNFYGQGDGANEDIYVSFKKENNWTSPKKLNSLVNTTANEFVYWISRDKSTLFFGRDGDIYMAPFAKTY